MFGKAKELQPTPSIAARKHLSTGAGNSFGGEIQTTSKHKDRHEKYKEPVIEERRFRWHDALFSRGGSGLYKIDVAKYRTGEMPIVSGAMGKEKIHYIAPPQEQMPQEMDAFCYVFFIISVVICFQNCIFDVSETSR